MIRSPKPGRQPPAIGPWNVPLDARIRILRKALSDLHSDPNWKGAELAGSTIVERAARLGIPQPTVEVPGQRNYSLRSFPRGAGLVVAGLDTTASELLAMVVAPLAAGNGLLLCHPYQAGHADPTALIGALHAAGVPPSSATAQPIAAPAEAVEIAPRNWAFVLADLDPDSTQELFRAAAVVGPGQSHLTALFELHDGPSPLDDRFERQFCLEKTVAIRTLRHGADLGC